MGPELLNRLDAFLEPHAGATGIAELLSDHPEVHKMGYTGHPRDTDAIARWLTEHW